MTDPVTTGEVVGDQADHSADTYAAQTARLAARVASLDGALLRWRCRDGLKADAEARQAAGRALDHVDQLLVDLHELRSQLMGEVREVDEAALARADALLARIEAGQARMEALLDGAEARLHSAGEAS